MTRAKLTVVELKALQTIQGTKGPFKKLAFKAKDGDKEFWFATYKKNLFEHIVVGAAIEADVEISETEQGTNRKVTALYKDGQAIGFKAGGHEYGKSLEAVKLEQEGYDRRAKWQHESIEGQVYFKGLCDLLIADKLSKDQGQAVIQYAMTRLGLSTRQKTSPVAQEPTNSPPPPINQGNGTPQTGEGQKTQELTMPACKNAGAFKQAVLDTFDVSVAQMGQDMGVYDLSVPGQREKAWQFAAKTYKPKGGTR